MVGSPRYIAANVLNIFSKNNKPLKEILKKVFSEKKLDRESKKRVKIITNDIMRLRGIIDYFIELCSSRKIKRIQPKVMTVLRIGSYELIFDDRIPNYASLHSAVEMAKHFSNIKTSSFVNGLLRKMQKKITDDNLFKEKLIKEKSYLCFPEWLTKKWKMQFGKNEMIKLCGWFLTYSPMHIRVDSGSINVGDVIKILKSKNINAKINKSLFNYIEIISRQEKILDTHLFKTGKISIQDPAAGAIINLINPQKGDTILDICAAPGTKTLYLSECVGKNGKVKAFDINKNRINLGKIDSNRHNKENIDWFIADATKDEYPFSEKILIDAPCTGTGVLGRRPDIKWRINKSDINKMHKLQFSILCHMSKFLLPGGRIVYSTCSLEPEENSDVIYKFLEKNIEFKLISCNSYLPQGWVDSNGFLMTIPYKTKSDALFGAILMKNNEK